MNFTPRRAEAAQEMPTKYESIEMYMAKKLITFNPNQNMGEAIETMLHHRISGASVVDNQGNLVGILSEKDCIKLMVDSSYHNLPLRDRTVADYMTHDVKTVDADMDVLDVANEFMKTNYRRFPVLRDGKLIGQVSRRDILRAIHDIKANTWGK